MEHKCKTCRKSFTTCNATKIVWGIDRDPSIRGADADKVLECDAYTPNEDNDIPPKVACECGSQGKEKHALD